MSAVIDRLLDGEAAAPEAETEIRAAVNRMGKVALQTFIQARIDHDDAQRVTPPGLVNHGRRSLWVRSTLGDFQVSRNYYRRAAGGPGAAPADGILGLWRSYTPAMARVLCKLTAQLPFEAAADLLRDLTPTSVNGREFHRVAAEAADAARHWVDHLAPPGKAPETLYVNFDGVGVPMRKECLQGRRGRADDGQARTREVRLACVFTQTKTDRRKKPRRDPASTTYLASLCSADVFGPQVKAEAIRRGMAAASRLVILSDGAHWCTKLAATCFPGYLHILDFYHAAEHLHDLTVALFGDGDESKTRFRAWRHDLRRGLAADIIDKARSLLDQAKDQKEAEQHIAYLSGNLPRMNYAQYRAAGLFIGSGVIEAGCKTIVAQRAKLSGMSWGEQGVQDVLTLRCLLFSGRFDLFWNHATAALRAA